MEACDVVELILPAVNAVSCYTHAHRRSSPYWRSMSLLTDSWLGYTAARERAKAAHLVDNALSPSQCSNAVFLS